MLDNNTLPISTSYKKYDFCDRKVYLFQFQYCQTLTIFICDNKLLCFIMFHFFLGQINILD